MSYPTLMLFILSGFSASLAAIFGQQFVNGSPEEQKQLILQVIGAGFLTVLFAVLGALSAITTIFDQRTLMLRKMFDELTAELDRRLPKPQARPITFHSVPPRSEEDAPPHRPVPSRDIPDGY